MAAPAGGGGVAVPFTARRPGVMAPAAAWLPGRAALAADGAADRCLPGLPLQLGAADGTLVAPAGKTQLPPVIDGCVSSLPRP